MTDLTAIDHLDAQTVASLIAIIIPAHVVMAVNFSINPRPAIALSIFWSWSQILLICSLMRERAP